MKKETVKKLTYPAALLILAAALIPSNLPFIIYIRSLSGASGAAGLKAFYESGDISSLPLTLGGRFFYTFFPFIVLLSVLLLLWRILHRKKITTLFTGAERFRWRLFGRGLLLWLLFSAVADLVQFTLRREDYLIAFEPVSWLKLLVLGTVFIIPQVMLEETFFRGYLIKGGTLFTGKPVLSLCFFSALFGLLHSANPEVSRYGTLIMMPQYIGMGLFLSYLSWETDGLELALGIHLANNGWGLLVVNSGGTAFETPSPFTMVNWNPYSSLIFLSASMLLFILASRRRNFFLVKKQKGYYYNN